MLDILIRCQGNNQNAGPSSEFSDFPSYNFDNKFLQCDKEDSRFHDSWQIEELVLYNPAVLLNSFICSAIVPAPIGFNPQEAAAKFFGFCKNAEDGPYRAGRFSKTFPEVPNKFQIDLQASPDVPNDFRVLGCKQ